MNKRYQALLEKYDYVLPEKQIAQQPASPRDAARLLVYQKASNKTFLATFAGLPAYLPKNAVLVFNQTRVIPARFAVTKPTGGKAQLLYVGKEGEYIKALSNKPLAAGSFITLFDCRQKALRLKVIRKAAGFYYLKPDCPAEKCPDILQKYGQTPLPPYIKHSPLTEKQKREKYQAVFAKSGVSVAAPTASLHFTKKLLNNIKRQGTGIAFVRLDVNLGTFAPLREEQIKTGKLHEECYYIDKQTAQFLNRAKKQGRPIIAVGTTVVRTLESACKNHCLTDLCGNTDLFIQENYQYRFVDGLITNFHVPKSSLLMMVAALTGREKLFELYNSAMARNFRFFSFGDGMLILP